MTGGRGLPDEPRAMQHSILLLHALLGGLQQANHILRLLVVHLIPCDTLLEREGERGRGGGGREEGGRERITCLQHTSHNEYMHMYTVMWVRIPPGAAHFFFEKERK